MTDQPQDLPKTFDPAAIEARWYAHWEEQGLFRPDRPGAEPWTIVNPPPNVTGSLHIGHALDNTLQDILVRHARLQGKDARWVVGTDHAGIATQMVVERQLNERQDKRSNYSREDFVAKVWEWKAESGGQITRQLRRLGCSMDWANERFTMDEGFSRAVLTVFVDLYNQGLLYRDKRLVNWDPGLGTAISDLEVETREVKGHFWRLRYPLADNSGYVEVATTRPETMLADMAVAVHPNDARYTALIGKQVKLPITGRLIPIVADEHADPELGSGAVKITPGHDFNDFDVGRRAGIEARDMLNMLDAKAAIAQTSDGKIPEELIGLDRFEARRQVVERLRVGGFLVPHVDKDGAEHEAEPRTIQTPYGDRSGEVIEPWLTDQWYVDAKTLAQRPIEAVKSGAIRIVPKSWEKTFFNWMENIQPWCVSRQLWWGHRIPAWFGDDGKTYVALTEEEAQAKAGPDVILVQDPDVLDTWFSSALWPFATIGWPEDDDPTIGGRYPNDVLISGFDILFFWDARMMMQGMHFMDAVPFRTLYLHGLVRAADGAKMSKSKGNTVDPLGLIDRYGADALRFFMAAMESQGRDIKMDEKRVEGYRNFATKLWNAARFCQANGIGGSDGSPPGPVTQPINSWLIHNLATTIARIDIAIGDLRFDDYANRLYQFVWAQFCDCYLEAVKVLLSRGDEVAEETRRIAGWVFDCILKLLHPIMPFITEELWHALAPRNHDLIVADWPHAGSIEWGVSWRGVDSLFNFIADVRSMRSELNIPPGVRLNAYFQNTASANLLRDNTDLIGRLGRIADFHENQSPPSNARAMVSLNDDLPVEFDLTGVIDLAAERDRLTKAIAVAAKERDALAGRLNNASFVERAKPEAVEKARADHAERAAEAGRLSAALARLG